MYLSLIEIDSGEQLIILSNYRKFAETMLGVKKELSKNFHKGRTDFLLNGPQEKVERYLKRKLKK